jgi:uncharacterized protein
MKVLYVILLASGLGLLLAPRVVAQQSKPLAEVGAVARYHNRAIELRWLPKNTEALRLVLRKGVAVERATGNSSVFVPLATVTALDPAQWEEIIAAETLPAKRAVLERAMELMLAPNTPQQPARLEDGVDALIEQSASNDMIHTVLVISTLQHPEVARGLGWVFRDSSVERGQTYVYRVKPLARSDIYDVRASEVTVTARVDAFALRDDVLMNAGDSRLTMVWTPDSLLTGYTVERLAPGEKQYRPLNTVPIYPSHAPGYDEPSNVTFTDDSVTNYKTYRYRLYGTSAFGERVQFAEVVGIPVDRIPPPKPTLKQPKHTSANAVTVTWELAAPPGDLAGFVVGRSSVDTGGFAVLHPTLLTAKSRKYVDSTVDLNNNNFYLVYAVDTSGNMSTSFPVMAPLIDSTPPSMPKILSALCDSTGVVTIRVQRNSEADLKGYRLFTSNSLEHEFSALQDAFRETRWDNQEIVTTFYDTITLASLTPEVYYTLKALDFNYNESPFAEAVRVIRPDTIAPVTPVFTAVRVTDRSIHLQFARSESIDVHRHKLYRKLESDSVWQLYKEWLDLTEQFVDTAVTVNTVYHYALQAEDHSKLASPFSHAVYGKPYDNGVRPEVVGLRVVVTDSSAALTWEYPSSATEPTFVIYQQNEGGNLMKLASTKDRRYAGNASLAPGKYAVKVFTEDGGQSRMSAIVAHKGK